MTVLAISADTVDDSRAFARDYELPFPLLSDPDELVARRYTGATSDDNALPGVTIIRRDGRIAFRQISSAKDDRISAADLLATLDRELGTTGPAAITGYAAIDRAQLRVEAGGGAVRDGGDVSGTGVGAMAALVPLGRHVLVGPWLGFEAREAPLDLDAAVILRAPIWTNSAALELGFTGGWTPWRASGGNLGARAGLWFAWSPKWSIELGAGVGTHGGVADVFATIGVARLFRVR